MKKYWVSLVVAAAGFCSQAEIQTAESLLVNLKAADFAALANGAQVPAWTNAGTLGGVFTPVSGGAGVTYATSVAGVPAVQFAGTIGSLLTNSVKPSATILSNDTWTAEAWIYNPELSAIETFFSWTPRTGLGDDTSTVMEFRYGTDTGNCVEHYGSYNIPWGGNVAYPGYWHYLALTRASDGLEKLFVDGILRTSKTVALKLPADGVFTLGGVQVRPLSGNSWTFYFSGSLAAIRVHAGTLPDASVVANYTAERTAYQSAWVCAAGQELFWADAANWANGTLPADGAEAWINNGGTAVLTNRATLKVFEPFNGGLTIREGAKLTLKDGDAVSYLAVANPFALNIVDGELEMPGNGNKNLYMGINGGAPTVTVGGSGRQAVLLVDRDTILADSSGSVGTMTVGEGGSVCNSNGWFYAANNSGAKGYLTLNGGVFSNQSGNASFVINANGSYGAVTVNSGKIVAAASIKWSGGTAAASATGILRLNGGTLDTGKLYAETTSGTNLFYMNGGIVHARATETAFLQNFTAAYVQAGGAKFDIPAGVTVTIAQPLLEDPTSTGGGLTKTGAGRLVLTGTNNLTGPVSVESGELLLSNDSWLTGYYGTITVAAGAGIGYAKAGGAAELLAKLDVNAAATLILTSSNATDTVDFSSRPNMRLDFDGSFAYTGTFTPYKARYLFNIGSGVVTNSTVMTDADAQTPGRLEVVGKAAGKLVLFGDSSFTGGVLIDGCTVVAAHTNALGARTSGGARDVTLTNNAVLAFETAQDLTAFVATRLTTGSDGNLLLGNAALGACNLDLSQHPGITLGAALNTNVVYTATLTPANNTYRLGGGNTPYSSSYKGLTLSTLADIGGAACKVVGDKPGLFQLASGNTYSGGTVISNSAAVYLAGDGFGAVPAAEDAANITLDKGTIRGGEGNAVIPATRGVKIGQGGATFHQWSTYTLTFLGSLSGNGPVTMTDTGWVTFGGANNTYNGKFTVSSGARTRIGTGNTFSWNFANTPIVDGTLALDNDTDATLDTAFTGGGTLRKEGSGELTLTAKQAVKNTTVAEGVLRVAETNTLSSSGMTTVESGARLETDGRSLSIGGLAGKGTVTNRTSTAGNLYIGADGQTTSFGGTVDDTLTLVKQGNGTQILEGSQPINSLDIKAGTVETRGAETIGTLAMESGKLLVNNMVTGLDGYYYNLSSVPSPLYLASLENIAAFQATNNVNAISNSVGFGTTFSTGSPGVRFPAGYANADRYVVIWSGYFIAETAGSYGFATASDDGSILFLDGVKVVNNNSDRSYTDSDRTASRKYVTLSKGLHPITIGFYENSGQNAITVFLTRPNAASDEEMPNRLLCHGSPDAATTVNALTCTGGTIVLGDLGAPVLKLTVDTNTTMNTAFSSSNAIAIVEKQGTGTLTLTAQGGDYQGLFHIAEGAVSLNNAYTIGVMDVASNAQLNVDSGNAAGHGLTVKYYEPGSLVGNYADYTALKTYTSMLAHFASLTPTLVTNSISLGSTLTFQTSGSGFHGKYSNSGTDKFEVYLSGYILLDKAGTYTFGTVSDDGSIVYIDGVAGTTDQAKDSGIGSVVSGTVTLGAGMHRIDICYRENGGGQGCVIYMAYPGRTIGVMPQSILYQSASLLRGISGEAGSSVTLNPPSLLFLGQDADTLFAGNLSGASSCFLIKDGIGTLTLTGTNAAFASRLEIINGTVAVTDEGTLGTASVNIYTNGTLLFNRAGAVSLDGSLSGLGTLIVDGGCELSVASTNNFMGTVEVRNGILRLLGGAALGAEANLTNSATVVVQTAGVERQKSMLGTMSGNGTLEVSGNGILAFDGTDSQIGTVKVDAGATARVGMEQNLGGASVSLAGGTLSVPKTVLPGTNVLANLSDFGLWQFNGASTNVTVDSATWIQTTPNEGSKAGSAFLKTPIDVGSSWYARFTYRGGTYGDGPADGSAFVIQTSKTTALGSGGGTMGGAVNEGSTTVFSPAVALYLNIYNADAAGWTKNGTKTGSSFAAGFDFLAGVDVVLTYDSVQLSATLTQGGKEVSSTLTIDLKEYFGQSTAYVGFSGGTGGAIAQQLIGNFEMRSAADTQGNFNHTAISLESGQTGTIALTATNTVFASLNLSTGSVATVAAGTGATANENYQLSIGTLNVQGAAQIQLQDNGTGSGILALDTLNCTSGQLLTVTGGKLCAPGGVLTILVSAPVPKGMTQLVDFTGSSWYGKIPTVVLKDANGNVLKQRAFIKNGRIYINTSLGTVIMLKS